jgi:membrane protein involved in colicin uptake
MKIARLALLAIACSVPLAAAAQWQWVDNQGRRVFSDQPPPPDIAPNKILRQPGGQRAAAVPAPAEASVAPTAAAAAAPNAAVPKPSGKDPVLEARRKQAEAVEAARKKEEEDKYAAQLAENCKKARENKAMLDSGVRVARTNDKGEREIMDDAMRAAESKRLQDIIGRDCAKT